jgi:membrane protein DedA with SNARE-associated domain
MFAENFAATAFGLFLLTFAHEETAIIAGGYLVTAHGLAWEIVLLVLTLGVITGDWTIYALGAAARRLPRLERFLAAERIVASAVWLRRRMLFVIVVARLFPGPGILFPVFSGLGLLGVGFPRFALGSATVAAVYTPAMLYLTIAYGDALVPHLGWAAWVLLLVLPAFALVGPWSRPLRRWASHQVGLAAPGAKGAAG